MKKNTTLIISSIMLFSLLICSACRRDNYDSVEDKNLKGYVLGKETCNADVNQDYWLIDFTYGTFNRNLGDTLTLNGITYTNVLKTSGLVQTLKTVGLRVSIDYNSVSSNKIITSNCTVSNPVTYLLKEVSIKNQGEIR
jgi:hypothetical protein